MTIIPAVPDEYSERYHYTRHPAQVEGRRGHFAVWSREVDRPNPHHVTWTPDLVVISRYPDHGRRVDLPTLTIGQQVRLGDLVIEVPRRAAEYVSHVPCVVID